MLFNSLQFVVFFPIVVMVYFALPFRFRWAFLLAASYYFYGCWRANYLVLLFASTILDYVAGLGIGSTNNPRVRTLFLLMSLIGNFGMLFTFKYFNFFTSNFEFLFDPSLLHI